ncbi:hypothetical protein AYO49_05770 [Verrucomicrobiaceae bacterium SCGC AG-212-N21]|nr:hypothetical protein AYO49_05770 [Verrucomicrobiaceae bacterium SCGC AG-212-N21]
MSRRLLALLGFIATEHLRGAERIEHANGLYHVFRIDKADLAKLDLRWLGDDGKPLMSFDGLRAQLAREKKTIGFATNAGIYERGPKPLGLTISDGKELVPLNLRNGDGNFYKKPNGVFFVDAARGAGVMEAAEFAKAGIKPRLATQSGPLLLRHGVIHPEFDPNSKHLRQRSGVGVRASDGQVIFVVSDRNIGPKGSVRFHQFASFFLHLGCRDALYLDGDLSDMITDPPAGAVLPSNTYAAMFVIAK